MSLVENVAELLQLRILDQGEETLHSFVLCLISELHPETPLIAIRPIPFVNEFSRQEGSCMLLSSNPRLK